MQLEKVSQEGSRSEKQCSELRAEVDDLTHKLSALKEKVSVSEQMVRSTSHNEAKKIFGLSRCARAPCKITSR